MLQKKETLEQKESSLETLPTGNVMPCHGINIIQHIHPPAFSPTVQPCTSCPKNVIDEFLNFLLLFRQLSPLERNTVILMVKDSSTTEPLTEKVIEVVRAALKLTISQWQLVLEIVNINSPAIPVEPDNKVSADGVDK
jgi:hypothetical protein